MSLNKRLFTAAFLLLSPVAAQAAPTELLTNGSFDNGTTGWTTSGSTDGDTATGTCNVNVDTAPGTETATSTAGFTTTATNLLLGSVNVTSVGFRNCVTYQDIAIPAGATTATLTVDAEKQVTGAQSASNAVLDFGIYSTTTVPKFSDTPLGTSAARIRIAGSNSTTLTSRATTPTTFNVSAWAGTTVRFAIIHAVQSTSAGGGAAPVSGYSISGVTNVKFLVDVAVTNYTLTAVKAGTGTGTITASSGAISCGTTCSDSYADGTSVTLTAAPTGSSTFTGWSGGTCHGTSTTYVVTVNAAISCTATFAAAEVTSTTPVVTPPPPWFGPATSPGTLDFTGLETTVSTNGQVSIAIPSGNFNDSGLTFTVSLDDGTTLPSWLNFDTGTLSFTGTFPGQESSIQPAVTSADRRGDVVTLPASDRPLAVAPLQIGAQLRIMLRVRDSQGRTATAYFPLTIYVLRKKDVIVPVSVTDRAMPASGASTGPSLSDDGQTVVFQTTSTNLFPADINTTGPDVIRYDVAGGGLDRFSTSTFMGSVANGAKGWNGSATISADARAIAFASDAADIGLPWNAGPRQIWVADASVARVKTQTPSPVAASTPASAAADGSLADGASDHPSLSEDGRFVAFDSTAGNLVGGTTAGLSRVYRKDRTTGAIVLVSGGSGTDGAAERPVLSADGRYVAFQATVSGIVQVYRRDVTTGALALVSASSAGIAGNDASMLARISRDGRYIAFQTVAANLSGAATAQIVRKDMETGILALVSGSAAGLAANAAATAPAVSGDGRFVAFVTAATNLGIATGGIEQIAVRDMVAGTVGLASTDASGVAGNAASSDPAISGDGRILAFASQATNLAANMTAGQLYTAGNPLQTPLETGWWWNPTEPGRGFAVEILGEKMMFGTFVYAADGTSVWQVGIAPVSASGWTGALMQYANGPTLSSAYRAATELGSAGTASLSIAARRTATLSVGGTTPLQRYEFSASGLTAGGQYGSPEAGWWWTPEEPVAGWFLEIQNSTLHLTGSLYDERGQASWVSSQGAMTTNRTFAGDLVQCAGGQTLAGAYVQPACATGQGRVSLSFNSPISGTLTLPNGRALTIKRYRF